MLKLNADNWSLVSVLFHEMSDLLDLHTGNRFDAAIGSPTKCAPNAQSSSLRLEFQDCILKCNLFTNEKEIFTRGRFKKKVFENSNEGPPPPLIEKQVLQCRKKAPAPV